ncbi:hypothetical protein [Kaistia nematophila]|uniref:Uncharacterized protein n=1 Tax=Kaistia nematophila TaxID=2994654 RepID=A0A9X3EEA6_9HYPH|nr:hypothetical protein [Kaistia nematophila]MCX5571495.1 hypothetical protein [Kaistia nematophila]
MTTFLAATAVGTAPALSEMGLKSMMVAQGLAEVINGEKTCGYTIDQSKLEAYYSKAGLDTPEALSHIANLISMAEFGDPPTPSACTMARATGKKIGILGEESP